MLPGPLAQPGPETGPVLPACPTSGWPRTKSVYNLQFTTFIVYLPVVHTSVAAYTPALNRYRLSPPPSWPTRHAPLSTPRKLAHDLILGHTWVWGQFALKEVDSGAAVGFVGGAAIGDSG
jgi:hypothetical protein